MKLEQSEKIIDNINLTPELLLAEGKATRTVQQAEENKYYMYYALKENAYKEMKELGKGNLAELKDIFLIDDKLNVRYISKDGKTYGDEVEKKILEDTTPIRFASKEFSEYISNKLGVKEEKMTFELTKSQTSLIIADSSINTLEELAFFPNLTSLTLGDTWGNCPEINTLEGVENCPKLTSLSIIGGLAKDYTRLIDLPNLKSFTRSYGQNDYDNIIDALKLCSNIENVTITNNNSIDSMYRIGELKDLKSLSMYSNKINKIEGLENKPSLETLSLLGNNITKIEGLENLKKLKKLVLTKNQITDITPLAKNTELTWLELKENIGIDGNKSNYKGESLEALNKISEILDRNGRINIDIDKIGLFTNYKNLDLSNQKMDTLKPLKGLTQLEILSLSNNQLTLKDFESQEILMNMKNLTTLNLNKNKITDIKVINNLTNLKSLSLKENEINLADIEDIISKLDSLEVSTENLKTIINCEANKITKLSIGHYSYITELPDLTKFRNLIELNLNNNAGIANVNILSNLESLQMLNLKSCNLHGRMINFTNLKNLINLDLSNNTLWDEDLENLKALKDREDVTINLSNNSIREATALLELNQNTKIILSGNVNLTENAKTQLRNHFKNNVTF